MKKEITFTLVRKTARQRFYKASQPLCKKGNGEDYRYTNFNGESKRKLYANAEKTETKDWLVPEVFEGVVVSDAHTHIERLCFPMWEINPVVDNNPYIFVCDTICGYSTMMIYGGSYDSVYPDKVYLRKLASANGYKFTGVIS